MTQIRPKPKTPAAVKLLSACKALVAAYRKNGDGGVDWSDIDLAVQLARVAILAAKKEGITE